MLGIFNKIARKQPAADERQAPALELDRDALVALLPYYPIGKKFSYYPEFKEELTLTTTIIAYAINNELVYSNGEISWKEEAKRTQIYLNGKPLKKIKSFCFIMPTASRSEEGLDYARREQLGKNGGFVRGNNITLKGVQSDGRLPVIDTTVRKQVELKEGHYIGHRVAILDVDPAAFGLLEQRRHVRLKTDVPGKIQSRLNQESQRCTMVDFSDRAARIIQHEEVASNYREGSVVTLSFDLPKSTEMRVIQGKVIRQHDDTLVMTLDNIMREKEFEKVESFDIMEIKANLLQQQAL